ncbi:MAG: SpoIIE family protein phosphatase [Deltaproteobacteria bacterium]|nr:SpoIIE family protein phosphatase [Deltaproteobacteria bacterium]
MMKKTTAETILLVDDNPVNRTLLKKILEKEGYRVAEAEDGEAAMEAVFRKSPDLVLLDIMMPKMDGYAVCAALIQDARTVNIPVIFLSAKTRPEDKIKGLNLGGADYVTKPFDKGEILARVRVHLKIRRLTLDLMGANRELQEKQARLDDDLRAAAEIQKSLLPPAFVQVPGMETAWRFIPSYRIGGDLFNLFPLDETHWGIYILDISGHGVPAAMVAVSAYQMLNSRPGYLLKKAIRPPPFYEIVSPSEVLAAVNREFPMERFDKFFTLSYLILNINDGRIRYSNAAHPPPVLLRKDGTVTLLKEGGTVIGLGEGVLFEEGEARLFPGDRLFAYTDGITEYRTWDERFFGEARFYECLQSTMHKSLKDQVDGVIDAMMAFGGHEPPPDDVSLLGIAFGGQGRNPAAGAVK